MAGLVQIQETPRWKKLLGFVGPGFLVSVAYLDPGNLETDLQAGADQKYELLWIVFVGLAYALIIQSRSANLGVVTGKHLSEHCKREYPNHVNYCLWALAELAVIAADIPEVIGTAVALNMLFKVPVWAGVLLAGLSTLFLLGIQKYGIRKLELLIGVLLLVVGGCFFAVMVHARPSPKDILVGMFVPKLRGDLATRDAVALLGALIMPHNLFLHSALVISRKIPHTTEAIRTASNYFTIESGIALFFTFLINISVVSLTASVCYQPTLSPQDLSHCKDITLQSAAFLLKSALGTWSSKLFAVSLLASGQSSTVTGTYAGQYIMQGFLDLKMELWLRNLLTRTVSIAPSLVACLIGGSDGAAKLIIIASMILSFELPFALIPLLRFTSSEAKMHQHKNSLFVSLLSWLLGFCTIGINMYFISTTLMRWMTSRRLPKALSTLAAVFIFPVMIAYVGMVVYLVFKPETPSSNSDDSDTGNSAANERASSGSGSYSAGMERIEEIGM